MSPVLLAVLILANWRLAHLIAEEGGPWDVVYEIRATLGVRYDEYSQPYGTNVIASAAICVWCNSFWVGVAQAAIAAVYPEVALWLFLPFALSAGAIAVNRGVVESIEE